MKYKKLKPAIWRHLDRNSRPKGGLVLVLACACLLLAGCQSAPPASTAADAPAAVQQTPAADTSGTQRSGETHTTPAPTAGSRTEAGQKAATADELLAGMTLEEKVYQMFVVSPESLTGYQTVTAAGDATREALARYPVGGIMYSTKNLQSSAQAKALLAGAAEYSSITPFLTVDEEGGQVARVASTLGTTKFEPMYTYKDREPEYAYTIGATIAQDLRQFGFNQDYAPVADIWTNQENTVIATRAFSDTPDETAELVAAAVQGFLDNGIIPTIKHFPGHGDTTADTHTGSAYSYKTLDELRGCEFVPFAAGIEAGAPFVMCAHITVPAVDDQPASMSYRFVTEILRGELGFDGVVITDALEMQAIAGVYSPAEAAVRVVQAGVDMLLSPENLPEAAAGILQAVQEGEITEERIDESVLRILQVKEEFGLL